MANSKQTNDGNVKIHVTKDWIYKGYKWESGKTYEVPSQCFETMKKLFVTQEKVKKDNGGFEVKEVCHAVEAKNKGAEVVELPKHLTERLSA